MSLPGPVSLFIQRSHKQAVVDYNKTREAGHFRTFFTNRLNYYKNGLIQLASSVSENGTIPITFINSLMDTVRESADKTRVLSTRVILYGMVKRFPDEKMENLYLDRESSPQIEDMLPGNYIPTMKGLPRKKLGNQLYNYESSKTLFEDFSSASDDHAILLSGDVVEKAKLFTGLPCVLIGRYQMNENEKSTFEVEEVHKMNVLSSLEVNDLPKLKSRKVLTISGLDFGNPKMKEHYNELIDNLSDPDSVLADVTHVFIVGHSIATEAWKTVGKLGDKPTVPKIEDEVLKVNATILSKKIYDGSGAGCKSSVVKMLEITKYIKQLDAFLCEILELFPVTIFPGGDDPGYQKPPFAGFDRELFVKAAKYKNFRCASGNSDAMIKDDSGKTCEILALSNKLQIASDDEKMRLILTGLECGQTVPGAPFPEQIDTFYTLSANSSDIPDPFMFKNCPNVVLTLNNTKKCVKITPKSDQPEASIVVQSISDFSETKTVQVLDLESYTAEYFTF